MEEVDVPEHSDFFCFCRKQQEDGSEISIASHPYFGDVISSKQMLSYCILACSFKWEHAFYSGDKLLGKIKDSSGLCRGYKGLVIDENSLPLLRIESYKEWNTQVFK